MELFILKVSIYETYHCGAVTSVGAWNPSSQSYVSIYHGLPTVITTSRIFEPPIEVKGTCYTFNVLFCNFLET